MAAQVAVLYGIPHISTGDIFRGAIKAGTPLGKKVKGILDSGSLVGDEVTIELVRERLSEGDAKKGFILDGFPRTIPQAEALSDMCTLDGVVNFEVPDDTVVRRLSGRRVCKQCGHNHHIEFMPPKAVGQCDTCGGELFIREDDKIDAITHRLEVYRKQTAPLIDYYRAKNLLVDIDGTPVSADVKAAFVKRFS
jgi:adenylate kinase